MFIYASCTILQVSTIPLPSTSKPSGSQIFSSHKSSRPYRSTKKPVVIDDDDDGDAVDQVSSFFLTSYKLVHIRRIRTGSRALSILFASK